MRKIRRSDLRETLKAKLLGNSSNSMFSSVLFPLPDGPLMTMGWMEGSDDMVVRVWDTARTQTVRIINCEWET